MSFLDELKRRRVVRVALVYAATAFVVLQAADLLAAGLVLPPWIFTAITVFTVLGFPLALVLAWAFQVTPDGVQRTGGAGGGAAGEEAERWLSRRSLAAVGVALVLVLAGGWFINPIVSTRIAQGSNGERPGGPVLTTLVPPPGEVWQHGGAAFAVSPDGRRVALVVAEATQASHLAIRTLDDLGTTRLPGTAGANLPFWSPDGRSLGFFARGQLRVIDVASGETRALCPAVTPAGGTWGRDDVILFVPEQRGAGLHRTTSTGGACERLPLRGSAQPEYGRPFFLGDGRHFVFSSNFDSWIGVLGGDSLAHLRRNGRGRAVALPSDHLIFRADGDAGWFAQRIDVRRRRMAGEPMRLTDYVTGPGGETALSASRNGVMLVQGPGSRSYGLLLWVDAAGGVVDSLVMTPGVWQARPSRDGTRVVLGGWELQLHERPRGITTRMYAPPDSMPRVHVPLVWGAADTVIAFTEFTAYRGAGERHDDYGWRLALFDPRTGTRSNFGESSTDLPIEPTDISADGQLLAFTRTLQSAATEVWLRDFAAAQSRRLFEDPGAAGEVRFSPDGRWLAWQSDAEGNLHVYVRDIALSRAPVRVSTHGGRLPRWTGDGRALLYAAPDGAIMAVALGGGGDITPSPPRTVLRPPLGRSDYGSFELTPDGGFLFRTQGGTPPGYTLIQDWTRLLEREERRR